MRQAEKPTCISYGPYGDRTPRANTPVSGFTGQPCEQHLSWYLLGNGYRAYNPMIMRFHSPDGLSPFGRGGLNTYAYCHGDPINFHDRSGRIGLAVALKPVLELIQHYAPSFLPDWAAPIFTNFINTAGASQPGLTIGGIAIADRRNGTQNVDLNDPTTRFTLGSSMVASVGAIGEAAGLGTGAITALGNSGVIAVGVADTIEVISSSHQEGARRNTPEARPMNRPDHTTVGGFDTVDTGQASSPRAINLGGRNLTAPQGQLHQLQIENAELRQRNIHLERQIQRLNQQR
ncbi:RHS repeat-associated core domain-containing protein [Pseudomonas mosselii]|uniref:RHS repeat-associated core domain-containing protein n=1 Tax=Pseudomonas mosselii TaxID=78327 RepID=UPI003D7697EF